MISPVSDLIRYRRVLIATTASEIRAKYAGTVLGFLWLVFYPILFLGLYATVYLLIFKVRLNTVEPVDYVLLIFSGLVPFLGFAEALGAGVSSVVANKSLVKNTLFPLELIPVRSALVSSMTMAVGLLLLHIVLWLRGTVMPTQAFTPLFLLLQIVFTIGVLWILSAITVFFKDLAQVITVIVLFLMLASPIAYTQDMIPPAVLPYMYANPLYYLITLYRGAIITGNIDWQLAGIFTLISCVLFTVGHWFFSRLKVLFGDYL